MAAEHNLNLSLSQNPWSFYCGALQYQVGGDVVRSVTDSSPYNSNPYFKKYQL